MLLIPFIENAFKHGLSASGEHSFVRIRIHYDEPTLKFQVENSSEEPSGWQSEPAERQSEQAYRLEKHSGNKVGIGLKNTRRRLELIYPGKHHLQIRKEKNTFLVDLEIKLDRNS
jgi:sensor histidine kinase YesM